MIGLHNFRTKLKKITNVLVISCLGILLCSCGTESGDNEKQQISLTKEDTVINLQVDETVNGHPVQIPKLESKVQSKVVDAINYDIDFLLMDLYNKALEKEDIDPQVKTTIYDENQYLQIICRYVEFPLLGCYGDVVSYNYDRIKDERLMLSDALVLSGTTLDDLKQEIVDNYLKLDEIKETDAAIYDITVNAFRILDKDVIEYWGKLTVSFNEQTPWGYTYIYNFETKELTVLQED